MSPTFFLLGRDIGDDEAVELFKLSPLDRSDMNHKEEKSHWIKNSNDPARKVKKPSA